MNAKEAGESPKYVSSRLLVILNQLEHCLRRMADQQSTHAQRL